MTEGQRTSGAHAGDGWTYLTGLDAEKTAGPAGRAVPEVKLQATVERARIVRISFAAGDVMADHQAPAPIVVLGQVGEVELTVRSGEDDGTADGDADGAGTTVTVRPGTAIHIAARLTHSLRAVVASAVTLMVLTD